MTNAIDVTVPHSLTQEAAFARVLSWLQSQNKPNPHVTVNSVSLDMKTHAIVLTIVAYGYPVHVVIAVEADHVHVSSSPATDFAERAAMWFKSLSLENELGKVLS